VTTNVPVSKIEGVALPAGSASSMASLGVYPCPDGSGVNLDPPAATRAELAELIELIVDAAEVTP
jgi:hypothetical protein